MKHRQNAEEHAVHLPGQIIVQSYHQRRRHEVPVRQNHALAQAGGPGRVQQRRRVTLLDVNFRKLGGRPCETDERVEASRVGGRVGVEEHGGEVEELELVPEFGDSDDKFGIGVFGLFGDLGGGVGGVDGSDGGAEGGDGEEADDVADVIGRKEEDDVVFGDAETEEAVGDFNG